MSLERETARQLGTENDRPELLAAIQYGLQTFLNSLAREGFKLPLEVTLFDSHGDILREFTILRDGKKVLGRSANEAALYVFPLCAVSQDAGGRIGVLRLDAQSTEQSVAPEMKVSFIN